MTTTPGATAAMYAGYFHEAHDPMREVVGGLSPALLDWKPGDQTNSIAVLIAHALDSERHGGGRGRYYNALATATPRSRGPHRG